MSSPMTFSVALTAEQVATVERLQRESFPDLTLTEVASHLMEVAIGGEQNIHRLTDDPPPSMFEPVPF